MQGVAEEMKDEDEASEEAVMARLLLYIITVTSLKWELITGSQ